MSFVITLPPELLESIVGLLADDYFSLLACSLTCKSLVVPAHIHRFRNLTLRCEPPDVASILDTRTHIRPFIKHLELVELNEPWIEKSEATRRILNHLSPFVTSLTIYQRRKNIHTPRFKLGSISQLQQVEKITLKEEMQRTETLVGCTNLIAFLNQFPNLSSLTIEHCQVNNLIHPQQQSWAQPVFQLRNLRVGRCKDTVALTWLIPALSRLRRLYLWLGPTVNQLAVKMIQAAVMLEHLEMKDLHKVPDSDLQSLLDQVRIHTTNLRFLHLDASVKERDGIGLVQLLVRYLLIISPCYQLRTLVLELHPEIGDTLQCDVLETLLLGAGFPALQSIHVHLFVGGDIVEDAPRRCLDAFPRLSERGMVHVEVVKLHV